MLFHKHQLSSLIKAFDKPSSIADSWARELQEELRSISEQMESETYILGALFQTITESHAQSALADALTADDVQLQQSIKKIEGLINQLIPAVQHPTLNRSSIKDKLVELYALSKQVGSKLGEMKSLLKKHSALLKLKEIEDEKFIEALQSWLPQKK